MLQRALILSLFAALATALTLSFQGSEQGFVSIAWSEASDPSQFYIAVGNDTVLVGWTPVNVALAGDNHVAHFPVIPTPPGQYHASAYGKTNSADGRGGDPGDNLKPPLNITSIQLPSLLATSPPFQLPPDNGLSSSSTPAATTSPSTTILLTASSSGSFSSDTTANSRANLTEASTSTTTTTTPFGTPSSSFSSTNYAVVGASQQQASTTEQNSSSPTSVSTVSGGASTSRTPVIVGSVIGSLILFALIILFILIAIRRYKTRRGTIQFYEQKMVRPRELLSSSPDSVNHPIWEPLNLDDQHRTSGYAPGSEPLPAYGYSNYDFIEKADHQRTASPEPSPLPSGAMSPFPIPKIITTPATPPQSMLLATSGLGFAGASSPLASIPERPETGSSSLTIHSASTRGISTVAMHQKLYTDVQELRQQMDESKDMDPKRRVEIMKDIGEKLAALENFVKEQKLREA